MPRNRAEGHVIGELRDERKRSDTRETPAEHAEIQRCDRDAGDRAAERGSRARAVERDRPREREAEVEGDGDGEQPPVRALARQHDRPGRVGGLERVAAGRERVRGRGDPAQRCGVEGGTKEAQDRRIGLHA